MHQSVIALLLAGALAPAAWADCYPQWQAGNTYLGGARVTLHGVSYEAKWWTQGENPQVSGQWDVWKKLGPCVVPSSTATPGITPTPIITPTATPTSTPSPEPSALPTATATPAATPSPTAAPTPAPSATPAPPLPATSLGTGLQHYYRLDGNTQDSVANVPLQVVGPLTHPAGRFAAGAALDARQGTALFLPRELSGSYSIGFWLRMPEDMGSKLASIATNKDWETGLNPGISIGRNNDGRLKINIGDGSKRVDGYLPATGRGWVYVAISVDAAAKTLRARATDASGKLNSITLNYAALGNVQPAFKRWAFNEDARGDYYARYPAERFLLEYDEIAVWNRVLSDAEAQSLAGAGAPLAALNPPPTTVPTTRPSPSPTPTLTPTPTGTPGTEPPVGNGAPTFTIAPSLQAPTPDGMVVMFETAQLKPQVWVRRYGSGDVFLRVDALPHASDATVYHARLSGLQSNTLYEYYVTTNAASWSASYTSQRYAFKTWPRPGDGVEEAKFIVLSDTQDGRGTILNDIVNKGIMRHDCDAARPVSCAQNLAGILMSGDLVASGNSREQWRNHFFGRMQALTPYVPLIAAPGNHEYFGEEMGNPAILAQPNIGNAMKSYRKYFAGLPDNGSASYRGFWHATDYLGLKLLVLDSTPISGRHTHGNWTPLSMYWDAFRVEQLAWFRQQLARAEQAGAPFVFSIDHAPCLSEKWRNGEVIAACEFVAELEDYSRRSQAITGNLFGHVHSYARGHSQDVKHLWLNAASASGALEGGGNQGSDGKDLGIFTITRDEFGYNTLSFRFGPQTGLALERRSSGTAGSDTNFPLTDRMAFTSARIDTPPQLVSSNPPRSSAAGLNLDMLPPPGIEVLEAHWQFARQPDFSDAFDIWGNETRRENWFYTSSSTASFADTRAGKSVNRLELGSLLASREVLKDGGNDDFERWSLAKGPSCWTSSGARGGQCTHRSAYDRYGDVKPEALQPRSGETWYYRVRVRDTGLNWTPWSQAASVLID
ncbi:metallophosphoesterase [Chitinilyticum litopenaei]|uniref:metallophosphoesterase n=1 Tax=Chitinilyticum litopenaei TaxID=1121276 RepID=UPI00042A3D69|nr:metallophosphoesterase [Chitinilyticum litopenaei]